MVFFFHHYELPAILRQGPHIVAENDILEEHLDLLNQPPLGNEVNTRQPGLASNTSQSQVAGECL